MFQLCDFDCDLSRCPRLSFFQWGLKYGPLILWVYKASRSKDKSPRGHCFTTAPVLLPQGLGGLWEPSGSSMEATRLETIF